MQWKDGGDIMNYIITLNSFGSSGYMYAHAVYVCMSCVYNGMWN